MAHNNTPFTLRSILEKEKLNGTNYADLIRNLRIVLRNEKKEYILDTPLIDKLVESDIKKEIYSSQVLAVHNKPNFKKGNSWKKKGKAKVMNSKPNRTPKDRFVAENECFHCHEFGHRKMNCKVYLAAKKSRKGTFVIHITDIFLADSYVNSWVFDTGSVAHICNSMQGLIRSRSVERGEVDFRVGNNARVAALAVGTMQLHLPSGFILELNNCYFVPSLSRNIISPSCLMKDGYSFASENNGCSISKDGMFVAFASIVNGLFILNLDDAPICNITAKRPRLNELSPTYL